MIGHRSIRSAAALTAVLLAAGCVQLPPPQPDPYADVNRALRGERAIVELAGGEVATGVSHVRVGVDETSWNEGRDARQVPTGEVVRVIAVRRPSRAPAGILLLLGLGLSIAFDDPLPFALAADVALDEFIWGSEVAPSVGQVVYSGSTL